MKNYSIKLILCLILSAVMMFGIACLPAVASDAPYGEDGETPEEPDTPDVPDDHTHSFSSWHSIPGSVGKHVRHCDCGRAEHEDCSFDSGVVTKKPTHDAEGVRTYTCSECYGTKTEPIAKLNPGESDPDEEKNDGTVWIIVGSIAAVAVIAGAVVAVVLIKKKKSVTSNEKTIDEKPKNE